MTRNVVAETNMTGEERKARLEYLNDWFDDLRCAIGLSDWTLHFKTGAPSEGATAESWRRPASKEGVVRFSDEFFDSDREEQRMVTLHELLHFVMRPVYECHKLLEPIASPQTFTLMDTAFTTAEEWVVDSLARAIAHRFKLPPAWPADEPAEPIGVEVPLLMRFPDGDELRRTIVLGSEGLTALTDAITGIQAAARDKGKESWSDFTGRVRVAAENLVAGDGVVQTIIADSDALAVMTEDATPEIVKAEEVLPMVLEYSEASGIPEMQEYRPEPIEVPAFDPTKAYTSKKKPRGMA